MGQNTESLVCAGAGGWTRAPDVGKPPELLLGGFVSDHCGDGSLNYKQVVCSVLPASLPQSHSVPCSVGRCEASSSSRRWFLKNVRMVAFCWLLSQTIGLIYLAAKVENTQ